MEFGPETALSQNSNSTEPNSSDNTNPPNTVAQSAINNNNANNVKNSVNDVREKMDVVVVEDSKNGLDQTDSSKSLKIGAKDQVTNNTANNGGRNSKSQNGASRQMNLSQRP